MGNCSSGTQPQDKLCHPFKLLHRSSLTVLPRSLGVALSKILNWEIHKIINLLSLDLKSWLFGHLIQIKDIVLMSWLEQAPWSEIIHALLSLSQMRNSYLLVQNLEISALSKSRTKCLFLLNLYVLKESKIFKLSPTTKFVSVVVMDKLFYSMLTRISVNHWCKPNSMEASKAFVQVKMEFKLLLPHLKVSFIE